MSATKEEPTKAQDTTISTSDHQGSSDADDGQLPRDATQEEIDALPHVADKLPFAAWAVIVAGAFERFTYFGLIAPWRKLKIEEEE